MASYEPQANAPSLLTCVSPPWREDSHGLVGRSKPAQFDRWIPRTSDWITPRRSHTWTRHLQRAFDASCIALWRRTACACPTPEDRVSSPTSLEKKLPACDPPIRLSPSWFSGSMVAREGGEPERRPNQTDGCLVKKPFSGSFTFAIATHGWWRTPPRHVRRQGFAHRSFTCAKGGVKGSGRTGGGRKGGPVDVGSARNGKETVDMAELKVASKGSNTHVLRTSARNVRRPTRGTRRTVVVAQEATTRPRRGPSTNRVVFGTLAGAVALSCIGAGGWAFAGFAAVSVYHATQEYFGFVTAKGISQGMEPPTRAVSAATSALCVSAVLMTQIFQGRSGAALAVSGFGILTMNLLQSNKPRFSQLTSSIFGLFYCGFLPSFWLKMRALTTPVEAIKWKALASVVGEKGISVGLAATFLSVVCVIAADTGAYFGGKNFGRTQLISISPKKTWEGAIAGLLSSMAAAVGVGHAVLGWPATPLGAILLSVITFLGSVFGDLIESTMKRDAGVKDSGNLIPGHGGVLDRADGYMFTGSLVYAYVKYLLPML